MKIRGNTIGTTQKPEATLLATTGLTEKQKAQARENIGAVADEVVGDIYAALDGIIAIQENLISGGVNT